MVYNARSILVLFLFTILLAACTAPSTPAPGGPVSDEELPAAVIAAQQFLAQAENIPVEQVIVTEFEEQVWNDSCLGLGGAAESCLAAQTPGYRVTVQIGNDTYTLRTDALGEAVRLEE